MSQAVQLKVIVPGSRVLRLIFKMYSNSTTPNNFRSAGPQFFSTASYLRRDKKKELALYQNTFRMKDGAVGRLQQARNVSPIPEEAKAIDPQNGQLENP